MIILIEKVSYVYQTKISIKMLSQILTKRLCFIIAEGIFSYIRYNSASDPIKIAYKSY